MKTCFWGIRSASSNKQGTKSFFSGRNALKGTLFCSQLCFTRFFFTYLIPVFIILSILTIVYESLLWSLERTFYGTAAVLFVIIIVIITVFITFILILLVLLLLLLLSVLTMMQFKKFKLVLHKSGVCMLFSCYFPIIAFTQDMTISLPLTFSKSEMQRFSLVTKKVNYS